MPRGSLVLKIYQVFGQCSVLGLFLIVLASLLLFSAPTEVYVAFILVEKKVWGDIQAVYLFLFIFTA